MLRHEDNSEVRVRDMRKFLGKLLGWTILLGFLVGIVLLGGTTAELVAMDDAASWPARVAVVDISRPYHHAGGKLRGSRGPHWEAQIRCRYLDNGESVWIRHVRRGDFTLGQGESTVRAAIARYPVGTRVNVSHDPEHPASTLLEPHAPRDTMHRLRLLGGLLFVLPLVLWLFRKQ